ncbi:hypothetical protein [Niallia sp. NCCP-28]|uniref:hypothetical protein n=1 Tax=Niallia sp. NCCP-28 TaxID=2934712 RepID=UPI0020860199|nr:hypothetical protein [Niallia sp. NCCP-28]GKU82912.1 hypothetical protein NCCP28_23080 [Niallia sp. NCCP-28]
MNPVFKDQLKQWKKQHEINSPETKKQKKKETFSTRDLEYLMGTRKPRYQRHNGAIRQRG